MVPRGVRLTKIDLLRMMLACFRPRVCEVKLGVGLDVRDVGNPALVVILGPGRVAGEGVGAGLGLNGALVFMFWFGHGSDMQKDCGTLD